jgi:hypothetical protein
LTASIRQDAGSKNPKAVAVGAAYSRVVKSATMIAS